LNFSELGLDERLLRGIDDMGFTTPTPIQTEAIPAGMAGRDVLAAAMTGSGKTGAFLLPIFHRLLADPKPGTRVLVLTPTRELAAQIYDHATQFAKHARIDAVAIFGGVGMGPQEDALRRGVTLLIATPGRLLDHMGRPYCKLDRVDFLVIDEADRMLDMGFLPDVRRVLARIPKVRQTLFFSATLPPEVRTLSKDMLVNPVAINVERQSAPAKGITQAVWPVPGAAKSMLLLELIKRNTVGSVIVFTRTKHRTNRLSAFLDKHGIKNARIHGNRSQAQRTAALADFKAGHIQVLCATDIVARGIDVNELEHVVNFDVPHVPADYIHRVGRTARADAVGEAFTFVCQEEEADMRAIERAIGARIERRTLEGFDYNDVPRENLEIPVAQRMAEHRARQGGRGRPSGGGSSSASNGGGGGGGGGGGYGGSSGRPPSRSGPSRSQGGDSGPRRSEPASGGGGGGAWRSPGNGPEVMPSRSGPRGDDMVEVMPGVWRRGGR
jgi:ATP-dependent RNA helicase RhlE